MNPDPQASIAPSISVESSTIRHWLLLALIGGILFFAWLGRLPLVEPDEGRNAEVAREMLASGDFITPHFNDLAYLDKPAVYFWLVAASFRVAGINEFAARFPSALMALATVFLAWFLARRMIGDSAGLRAGIIFATVPLTIAFSRLVIFDMTLTFLVALALVGYWLAQESDFRRPICDVVFFAAMGVGAITKGPVGFLLPLLTVLAFVGVTGRWRDLKRMRWGIGVPVFLAAALPWFIAVSIRNPGFPRYAFWDESLQRFATGSAHRGGSLLYYIPIFLLGFFPWSFFLCFGGLRHLRDWRRLREPRFRSAAFLVAWTALIFVFFTISRSKLPGYFLPAVLPLSILTAWVWQEVEEQSEGSPRWLRAGFWTMIALGIAVAVLPQAFRLPAVQAALAEKHPPDVWALIRTSTFYSGAILIALGFVGRNMAARWKGPRLALLSFVLVALTVPILLVRWTRTISAHAEHASSRRLGSAIRRSPESDLAVVGYYCLRTGLPFYLRRPVSVVTADGGELTSNYISASLARKRRSGGTPGIGTAVATGGLLLDVADLRERAFTGTRPFLVLVRNRDAGRLSRDVPDMEPLWNDWEFSLWKIPAGKEQGTGNK